MLLPTPPASVDTCEEMIMFCVSKIIQAQAAAGSLPLQITEQYGYFPSDTVTSVPLRTVDGGYRQVVRLLIPVNPGYFGSNIPIWEFTGQLVA